MQVPYEASIFLLFAFPPPLPPTSAAPTDILGAYGFQLSGSSTISGRPSPVGGVGRLVFEDARRTVSGYSSVNFNGFFLGNPVTGSYEFQTDCTLTWTMQDDSGAFQHFKGTVASRRSPRGLCADRSRIRNRREPSAKSRPLAARPLPGTVPFFHVQQHDAFRGRRTGHRLGAEPPPMPTEPAT